MAAAAANDGEIWVSHHTHSQFLFLALSQNDSLVDLKLVDLDSGADWVTPKTSQEWFKIAREIVESLAQRQERGTKWNPHFFRYGTVSLWSELVLRQQSLCAQGLYLI